MPCAGATVGTMAWVDVVAWMALGSLCVGCDAPGRPWCAQCQQDLQDAIDPQLVEGAAGPPVVACAVYAGGVAEAIVGYKDRGVIGLREPLSHVVAAGVLSLLDAVDASEFVLVPAPSSPAAMRRRGFDHMRDLACLAGQTLGVPAVRLLRSGRRRDQAGLSTSARRANVAGSMRVRRDGSTPVVVVDDVRTSGATLAECERALTCAGHPVIGHVVVAAAM